MNPVWSVSDQQGFTLDGFWRKASYMMASMLQFSRVVCSL